MKLPPSPLLLKLELRRSLRAGSVIAALIALAAWTWDDGVAFAQRDPEAAGAFARARAREGLWAATLMLSVPVFALRAAGTVGRWRRGEGDWLGSRPTARSAALAWTWLGGVSAAWVTLAACAAAIELRTGGDAVLPRYAGAVELATTRRIEPGEVFELRLPDPGQAVGEGGGVRVALARTLGGRTREDTARGAGGRIVEVGLRLSRGSGQPSSIGARVQGRSRVPLTLPEGTGPATLRIENLGPGALAIPARRSIEFWSDGEGEGAASTALLLRAALLVAAAMGLGIGLGAWVRPSMAVGGLFALWLPFAFGQRLPGWLPGLRLPRDLAFVAEARLPEALPPLQPLGAAALVLVGYALARPALRSWRPGG